MPPLEFDAFRRAVSKGDIRPAYYFHGDEDLLKDDSLRDLLVKGLDPSTRDFNYDRRRAADLGPDEFVTLVQTPPMMAPRRGVVITEVEAMQQRRPRAQGLRAAVMDYLAGPAAETLLVLVQSAGEKPDADLARLATSVPFARLTPDKLERWIRYRAKQEGLELDEEASRHLRAVVGDDLPQLAAELAKLRGAVTAGAVTVEDVADLVGVRRGETAYDLVDAVTSRRFAVAADMVRHLLEGPGTSGVRLVMALSASLSGVAFIRAQMDHGAGPGAAANEMLNLMRVARPWGLRDYRGESDRWARDARLWKLSEIESAFAELLRADKRLKSTTLGGEAEILIDALLAMAGERVAA